MSLCRTLASLLSLTSHWNRESKDILSLLTSSRVQGIWYESRDWIGKVPSFSSCHRIIQTVRLPLRKTHAPPSISLRFFVAYHFSISSCFALLLLKQYLRASLFVFAAISDRTALPLTIMRKMRLEEAVSSCLPLSDLRSTRSITE